MLHPRKLHVALIIIGVLYAFKNDVSVAAATPTWQRSLIVGGTESVPLRYPFMASLSVLGKHQCGGTLIAPDIILTAAHCVAEATGGHVQLGRHNLTSTDEDYESFVWERARTHPRYYSHSDRVMGADVDPYDIAVLKLYGTSQQTVVPINRDASIPLSQDEQLLTLGWGSTSASAQDTAQTYSDVLRETQVGYIPNDICIQSTGTSSSGFPVNYEQEIIDVSLCASDFDTSGACTGDSGGPLLLQNGAQAGIISASFGCLHPTLPGLNVRISHVHAWIDRQVCELSSAPPTDFDCSVQPLPDSSMETVDTVGLSIEIRLDEFPMEWGWILQSIDSNGRAVNVAVRPILSFRDREPLSTFAEVVEVPNNREYVFTVLDSFGDGHCCGLNEGSISIRSADRSDDYVVGATANFGFSMSFAFVVGASNPQPLPQSIAPTSAPADSWPFLTVTIQLDEFPTETGYFVEALFAESVQLVAAIYPGTYFGPEMASSLVREQVYLLESGSQPEQYRFTMTDNEHDGLGPGFYQVWLGAETDGILLFEGGDFFLEDVHTFDAPDGPLILASDGQESLSVQFACWAAIVLSACLSF